MTPTRSARDVVTGRFIPSNLCSNCGHDHEFSNGECLTCEVKGGPC